MLYKERNFVCWESPYASGLKQKGNTKIHFFLKEEKENQKQKHFLKSPIAKKPQTTNIWHKQVCVIPPDMISILDSWKSLKGSKTGFPSFLIQQCVYNNDLSD